MSSATFGGGREVVESRALLEEMWQPAELGDGTVYERPPDAAWTHYGLGWVLNLREEHPWVGGTGGLRAAFAVFPDDDVAVAVLTSLQGSGPERLVEGVFERVVAD